MNQQTEDNYSFCPRCGSLMEDGVCPECRKQKEQGVYSSRNFPQAPESVAGGAGQGVYPENPAQTGGPGQGAVGNQPGNCWQQLPYQGPGAGYYQSPGPGQPGMYQQSPGPGQPGMYQQNPYQGQPGMWQQNPGQGQPGMWQQNPYGQPGGYGPGVDPSFYGKPQKNNKVWITVGIVVGVIFALFTIIGSFYYGYFIMKLASGESGRYVGRFENGGEERPGGESGGDEPYDSNEYDDYEDSGEDTYVPSPEDEYYYGPCDAIDENVAYSLKTKSYTNEDPDNNIDVVINYFELEGEDIPNIDQLNEALEKVALYYVDDFPQYSAYAEYGDSYTVYITSYVTYNDDEMISIVMDEYIMVDDRYHLDLYPINIDVRNGVVLDNDSLLDIDAAFAEEFRERNERQNGSVEFLDSLTDEELAQFLRDRDSVIAYYTPLGMEVGLNYETAGSSGWVTVTYKDYDRYLSRF